MQTPTDLNTDSTVTMDSDFHNNNLANKDAGKKRRMVDDNQQAISQFQKKTSSGFKTNEEDAYGS